ncbi:undecaprenyl pyrophosphate synthase UppS [Clostridium aceticum]|uniref:Undecaprenyl pyrophosphate synthase UppS n=1 Tax=Clostridium aceticum TaxID=84022 RepID=A0A0D8IEP3_9CLOT|nr:polyprenyl diphosphate synthase [Clostridium aceticum]AKL95390.1 undecaprenyl pyrophosphate synthase UppS [Clostridium aceticum]KJF28805.1 dihydroorotate dehydrogenase [Clostridium aceticum]
MRVPAHIGIIPDGNRRWAESKGLSKEEGYEKGLRPGLEIFKLCQEIGIKELSYYGFTMDNTKRPSVQTLAFRKACVDAVEMLCNEDASLLVLGNATSPLFPKELETYTNRKNFGKASTKVNFLVNYGWHWDLSKTPENTSTNKNNLMESLYSSDVSRIDLIIRWGGRRRLSGFLPVQSVYSDFYVIDDYWPDFRPEHLYEALEWYNQQDVTLGG